MVTDEDRDYLIKRGYTDSIIVEEGLYSLPEGHHHLPGTVTAFDSAVPMIVFDCYSMSETISGIHTCSRIQKEYRYHPMVGFNFLPILYSSQEDRDLLFSTGTTILTEGVFDRIAVKRALPGMSVMARLSKGTSGYLSVMLRRYAKRLYLAFDMDTAGREGCSKAILRIGPQVDIAILSYPYKDPSLMMEKRGLAHLATVLKKQMEILS